MSSGKRVGLGSTIVDAVRSARGHRISSAGAEASFFALLSLAPALLAVTGAVSLAVDFLGPGAATALQNRILELGRTFLNPRTVEDVVRPAVQEMASRGGLGAVAVGFLLAAWSGSRATGVVVRAIRVAHRLDPVKGVRRRLRATIFTFALMIGASMLLIALLAAPAVAAWAADPFGFRTEARQISAALSWVLAGAAAAALIAALYRLALGRPVRPWPGALLATLIWMIDATGVRLFADLVVPQSPAYGALAVPVVLLVWLYIGAGALIAGAELNASIEVADQSGDDSAPHVPVQGDDDSLDRTNISDKPAPDWLRTTIGEAQRRASRGER